MQGERENSLGRRRSRIPTPRQQQGRRENGGSRERGEAREAGPDPATESVDERLETLLQLLGGRGAVPASQLPPDLVAGTQVNPPVLRGAVARCAGRHAAVPLPAGAGRQEAEGPTDPTEAGERQPPLVQRDTTVQDDMRQSSLERRAAAYRGAEESEC